MWWILLIFSAVTLVGSWLLINGFIKVINYPIYFSSILTLSIFLPLSIVFLLPIDLISSLTDKHSIFYINSNIILIAWKCNYWMTFILTWLVLPFLQSWYDNGQFNTNERFKASIKEVLKFQLLLLAGGIFGLIYIIGSIGFNFAAIKSLIITLSHIYALVLLLWLMSHSLISIPKNKFLNSAATRSKLNEYYIKLPKLNEEIADIKYNLKESCGKIMKLNDLKDYNVEFRDWIISLVEQVPQEYSDPLWYRGDPITNDQLSNKFMSKITKEFNNNFYRYNSAKSHFDNLLDKIFDLEDILGSETSGELRFRFKSSKFSPSFTYKIHKYISPVLNKVFSIMLAMLSVLIIESEMLHSTRFSLVNLIFKNNNFSAQVFENFFLLIIILTYMLLASLNSLSNIRIFNLYHLSEHQLSDPVSVIFFITYAARLTIPLSYNFTMLLNNSNNSFHLFIGKSLTLIPIGNIVNDWLPRLILIPILLSFFNVYERVINFIQLKLDFEFYSYFEDLEIENLDNEVQDLDIAKRNTLIQLGQTIAQQEANKISNGTAHRLNANLRPFNIRRPHSQDVESGLSNRIVSDRNSIDTSSVLMDDFYMTDSDIGGRNLGFSFKSLADTTSNFLNKFTRRTNGTSSYDPDNSIIPDHVANQYRDLEDDENLVI